MARRIARQRPALARDRAPDPELKRKSMITIMIMSRNETSLICANLRNLRLTWRRRRNVKQRFITGRVAALVA